MFRAYDKDSDVSYALGAFPALELAINRPSDLICLLIHSKLKMTDEIQSALKGIPADKICPDDRSIERIAKKGNVFMVGVFKKRLHQTASGSQIVLVSPSDAGNMGTIIRTAVGFGVKNLVIVGDAVDVFDPKVIRASMGSFFRINISRYDDFAGYAAENPLTKYLFMLDGSKMLDDIAPQSGDFALVFGNEASGLPQSVAAYGQPIRINTTDEIDSLALPQAVAIGLYYFTKNKF